MVNPANKRRIDVIVVGTGSPAGLPRPPPGGAGLQREGLLLQDSAPCPQHRRAGGINAAKNYQNDGDSTYRLFYDTIKGGDYRAREGNVYRLAEVSANIIDQCVAQGVPSPRLRRTAGQPLLRRGAGQSHLLRPGQTGPAAAARRYQRPEPPGGAGAR